MNWQRASILLSLLLVSGCQPTAAPALGPEVAQVPARDIAMAEALENYVGNSGFRASRRWYGSSYIRQWLSRRGRCIFHQT
jgi:hypothetical protein